jgi:hypothetical protein
MLSSLQMDGAICQIQFSETTDKGGLPDSGIRKAELDKLLNFSQPIGTNYSG